jgi:DNA-binding NarL/FixJ family response regulator
MWGPIPHARSRGGWQPVCVLNSAVRRDDLAAEDTCCAVYELGTRLRVPDELIALDTDLTSRQIAVGRLLANGLKDAAVARELNLSLRTVRSEISALVAGLGAKSRFQAGCLLVRRYG